MLCLGPSALHIPDIKNQGEADANGSCLILAIKEAEIGGSRLKASLGEQFSRPNTQKKGLVKWFKV
jgi:hypothetical protein